MLPWKGKLTHLGLVWLVEFRWKLDIIESWNDTTSRNPTSSISFESLAEFSDNLNAAQDGSSDSLQTMSPARSWAEGTFRWLKWEVFSAKKTEKAVCLKKIYAIDRFSKVGMKTTMRVTRVSIPMRWYNINDQQKWLSWITFAYTAHLHTTVSVRREYHLSELLMWITMSSLFSSHNRLWWRQCGLLGYLTIVSINQLFQF